MLSSRSRLGGRRTKLLSQEVNIGERNIILPLKVSRETEAAMPSHRSDRKQVNEDATKVSSMYKYFGKKNIKIHGEKAQLK